MVSMVTSADRKQVIEILDRNPWFNQLPKSLKALILIDSTRMAAHEGEVISEEDTPPIGIYAILKGQVAITRKIGVDKKCFLDVGGPGFWFGALGALSRKTAFVTVTAKTGVNLLFLPLAQFRSIVADRPNNYRLFAELTMEQQARMIGELTQAHGLTAEEELRSRLADISGTSNRDDAASALLELSVTQTDLANMIGCSRQTVNGLLKNLERDGLIDVAFRKIIIRDPKRLRDEHSSATK